MPSGKHNSEVAMETGLISSQSVMVRLRFHCTSLIIGVHAITSELSVFPWWQEKYFSCSSYSSLSVTLCNGESIGKYKAYWHMNFSLNNGVVSAKIMFAVFLSFEAALHCELTNIIIVTIKVDKQV